MLLNEPIKALAQRINSGELQPDELINECYSNIETIEPKVNAFITTRSKNEVLSEISELPGTELPLKGIPFVMKDSYVTKNIQTTAASKVLEGYVPQYNATVYQKLKDAGAILIGKTNMDAWGHGASTENTDFGVTKNPYDTERVAGGSSGGSAVAVASRMSSFAIGEDTGGSIRNPSAWNNISGLKVTYGRVSRYGCIAYASSFDTVGPMAKTAADIAYVMETIAGIDPYDATSSPKAVPNYSDELNNKKTLKIGVPKEVFHESLNPEIKKNFKEAIEEFKKLGHSIVDISIPMLQYGLSIYYLIGPSETSSNLGRYTGIRYGKGRDLFTNETMRRIMTGTHALSSGYYDAYYRKAQKGRTLLIQDYAKAFDQVDVLLMPINPSMPNKFGELVNDPIANMLADLYTITHNIVGIPSLAIPSGFNKENLPIGIQLAAPMFEESRILNLGYQYQQETNWHTKKPNI
jgi:aspartyl-tRNA(Asn)/glutamyl-tRNA(Gln) amidotransferase subunit A